MSIRVVAALLLGFLLSAARCLAQQEITRKLVLKVDETTAGPFGGQKSSSCLRVYSDDQVRYASWRTSAASVADGQGHVSRPEHTISVVLALEMGTASELSDFVQSRLVRGLTAAFGPPHRPIDYFETDSIEIPLPKGGAKKVSVREFYVASLEEKSRYPAALVVLMQEIDRIESKASADGTPADVPPDCQLKPK